MAAGADAGTVDSLIRRDVKATDSRKIFRATRRFNSIIYGPQGVNKLTQVDGRLRHETGGLGDKTDAVFHQRA
jgi:hypothetical protein